MRLDVSSLNLIHPPSFLELERKEVVQEVVLAARGPWKPWLFGVSREGQWSCGAKDAGGPGGVTEGQLESSQSSLGCSLTFLALHLPFHFADGGLLINIFRIQEVYPFLSSPPFGVCSLLHDFIFDPTSIINSPLERRGESFYDVTCK